MRLSTGRSWTWLAVVSAAAAMAAGVQPLLEWHEERLASDLTDRIAAADDRTAARLVRGLRPDSEPAIRCLAGLVASPREEVAGAARRQLEEWSAALQHASGATTAERQSSTRLALVLAAALAEKTDELGPSAVEWARDVARRLLDLVWTLPHDERLALVRDCGVLLAVHMAPSGHHAARLDGVSPRMPRAASPRLPPASTAQQRLLRLALAPGPLPDIEAPASLAVLEPSVETATPAREVVPPKVPQEGVAVPGTVDERFAAGPTAQGPALAWRSQQEEPLARVRPQAAPVPQPIDVPSPDAAAAREAALLKAPLKVVIAALASSDRFESALAESVLHRRGMSRADLQFARRLHGADATARLDLLEEMALCPGVRLVAWLQHFAEDEAAHVRHRALALLATSDDPRLRNQVYAHAIRDRDERIRDLAERLERSASISP